MLKFLTAAGVKGDFQKYFLNETLVPKTGIAFSGGGYRAMLVGAGIWRAMDSRTSENVFSGLLQGMDYMSGLSGGSWLIGSSAVNNFATIDTLKNDVWNLSSHFLTPNSFWETICNIYRSM